MSKNPLSREEQVLNSWQEISHDWVGTIDNQEIASRKLATNAAILSAVESYQPTRVLDLGCGEGWLTRELTQNGWDVEGVDGVAALIENAREKGPGHFEVASYEQIISSGLPGENHYDLIVCNYALFGVELVKKLLVKVQERMIEGGHFLIQTVHPQHPAFQQFTEPVWLTEDWKGMPREFKSPFDYYFRPMKSWLALFQETGWMLAKTEEVVHPTEHFPLSVIFHLKCENQHSEI